MTTALVIFYVIAFFIWFFTERWMEGHTDIMKEMHGFNRLIIFITLWIASPIIFIVFIIHLIVKKVRKK